MVDRIEQQTLPRAARGFNRFASPQAFGANNAGQAFEQFGYDVSDTLMARAQADAEVEAHKQVVDDIVYLENQRNETLQQSEPGAPKFTKRMKFLYEDLTKKRTEDLSELQKRSYMNRMSAYMPQFIRASAQTERQEATRHTKQTIMDTAEREAMLFDGFDYGRILQEAPMAIAATKEVIVNSPLSPADKQEMLDKVPAMTRESAVRAAARKDPYSLAKDVGRQYTPDVDGIAEFILDREGGLVETDGASGAPALFGINRRSFPEKFDEVKAVFDSGDEAKAKKMAAEFYKEEVIKKNGINEMPQDVALVVADGVVNHRYAIQKKLVSMAKEGATAEELLDVRQQEYDRLREAAPEKYEQSYAGWMARLQHVEAAIGTDTAITGNPLLDMAETPEEQERFRQIIKQEENRNRTLYRAEAGQTINDNIAKTAEGITTEPLPFEVFQRAYGETADIQYEQYQSNYTFAKTSAEVKTARPDEIENMLKMRKPKSSERNYAQKMKNFQAVQSAAIQEMQNRIKDPMAFATREGMNQAEELNFNDPDQLSLQLSLRNMTAQGLAANYQLPYQPLTEAEANSLTQQIPSMTVDQQLGMIRAMQSGFGENTAEAMAQFAGKDDIFAHVGGLLAAGGSEKTARDILRGREYAAANPKAVNMLGLDDTFIEYSQDAFLNTPNTAAAVKKATDNLYYIRALQKNAGTQPNKDIYLEAMNEVLGSADGEDVIQEFNDQPFILPVNYNMDQFDNFIDSLEDDDLARISVNGKPPTDSMGRKITAEQFKDNAQLISFGNGVYGVRFPNGELRAGDEFYEIKI